MHARTRYHCQTRWRRISAPFCGIVFFHELRPSPPLLPLVLVPVGEIGTTERGNGFLRPHKIRKFIVTVPANLFPLTTIPPPLPSQPSPPVNVSNTRSVSRRPRDSFLRGGAVAAVSTHQREEFVQIVEPITETIFTIFTDHTLVSLAFVSSHEIHTNTRVERERERERTRWITRERKRRLSREFLPIFRGLLFGPRVSPCGERVSRSAMQRRTGPRWAWASPCVSRTFGPLPFHLLPPPPATLLGTATTTVGHRSRHHRSATPPSPSLPSDFLASLATPLRQKTTLLASLSLSLSRRPLSSPLLSPCLTLPRHSPSFFLRLLQLFVLLRGSFGFSTLLL